MSCTGQPDNTGRRVRIHGITTGRIRLEAFRKDNGKVLDFYEAVVQPLRTVKFRVNLLKTADGKDGTTVSIARAKEQIAIANVILRQAGVMLVPDDDITKDPKHRGLAQSIEFVEKGFFNVVIANDPATRKWVVNDTPKVQAKHAMRVNDRDRVVQINYIKERPGVFASELNQPGNDIAITSAPWSQKVPGIKLRYRMTVGGSGGTSVPRTMDILGDQTESFDKTSEPLTWGLVITNASEGKPHKEQFFGEVVAHEIGHILGLRHRAKSNDGLPTDPRNLMAVGSGTTGTLTIDIDLIQRKAISGSKVFTL